MTLYLISYTLIVLVVALLFFIFGMIAGRRSAAAYRRYLQKKARSTESCLRHLLRIQEDERRETGIAIHDGLLQELIYLKVNLEELRTSSDASLHLAISDLYQYTDTSIRKARALAHTMIPFALRELGLATALKELMLKQHNTLSSELRLEMQLSDERLSPQQEIGIYRIIEDICEIHSTYRLEHSVIFLRQQLDGITISCSTRGYFGEPFDPICTNWIRLYNRIKLMPGTLTIDQYTPKRTVFTVQLPLGEEALSLPSD